LNINKSDILNNICYTELVYGRINKKLNTQYSKAEIEKLLYSIIEQTHEKYFQKIGKNIYVTSTENNIKITVNQNTYRIITVDRIAKS
jgi:hypothetical protein